MARGAHAAEPPAPGVAAGQGLPAFGLTGPPRPAAPPHAGPRAGRAGGAGAARRPTRPGPGGGGAHRPRRQPTDPACAGSLLRDRTADFAAAARDREPARALAIALLDPRPEEPGRAAPADRPALRGHDGRGFSGRGSRVTPQ